jgi:hypothetical protein
MTPKAPTLRLQKGMNMPTREQVEIALAAWKRSHEYLMSSWVHQDPLSNPDSWQLWIDARERDDYLRLYFDELADELLECEERAQFGNASNGP